MNELVTVNFNGQDLLATKDESGNVLVGMKTVCENIGLDWSAQLKRIKADEILNSSMAVIATTAQDGKNYDVVALPNDLLNGWLFGIDDKRVKNRINPIACISLNKKQKSNPNNELRRKK